MVYAKEHINQSLLVSSQMVLLSASIIAFLINSHWALSSKLRITIRFWPAHQQQSTRHQRCLNTKHTVAQWVCFAEREACLGVMFCCKFE